MLCFYTTTWFVLVNWSRYQIWKSTKYYAQLNWRDSFLRLRSVLATDDSLPLIFNVKNLPLYLFVRHLCSVEHPFRLEHHTHERRCYTARDHSYCSNTGPRPQKGKQPCWNGLRNSITVPKRKQVKGNGTFTPLNTELHYNNNNNSNNDNKNEDRLYICEHL